MSEKYPGSGTQMHRCDKPDCYFCYLTNPTNFTRVDLRSYKWTTTDVRYLLDNYGKVPITQIMAVTSKSRGAVYSKKYELVQTNKN
jgi:hypothetical protein